MGQRPAKGLHIALSALGAGLYFLFVIPRWWVLVGDIPSTLGTVGRIAAGFPIAAAAIPVMLTLRQALDPDLKTPELALRLRAWSAVLHVVAGALLVVTALVEIWLPLEKAGPWLFAAYGAAGSIAILAVAAFYLSFAAEQPPKPPKPGKPKKIKAAKEPRQRRLGRKRAGAAAGDETPADDEPTTGDTDAADTDAADTTDEPANDDESDDEGSATVEPPAADEPADEDSATETTETEAANESRGALKNIRPAGKRRHRLQR